MVVVVRGRGGRRRGSSRRCGRGGGGRSGWRSRRRRWRFRDRVVVADVAEAGERRAEPDAGARGALDGLLELEEDEEEKGKDGKVKGWRIKMEGGKTRKNRRRGKKEDGGQQEKTARWRDEWVTG